MTTKDFLSKLGNIKKIFSYRVAHFLERNEDMTVAGKVSNECLIDDLNPEGRSREDEMKTDDEWRENAAMVRMR